MSQTPDVRLPYAEASTPAEMHADCRVMGNELDLPQVRVSADAVRRDPHTLAPTWQVSDRAAHLAGSLHLHLN